MRSGVDPILLRALVAVADHGGVTAAAGRLALSQSAVSQHVRRLEALLGVTLFSRAERKMTLTQEGELALGYARGILRLQQEFVSRMREPSVAGVVRLGIPDLYAVSLLPSVIRDFGRTFPDVQIELHCRLSTELLADLKRGVIDLAFITRQPHISGGTTVRSEPLVWIAAKGSTLVSRSPLPLAMLPPGNLYRTVALQALERSGRQWRLACESAHVGGLFAAVLSSLAVSVVARCTKTADVVELGRSDGLPDLPSVELILHRAADATSDAVRCLEDYIRRNLTVA